MKSFNNKVAAITGAASGMGRSLAVELAKRGCHLAISDVNEVGLKETAELVSQLGVKVTTSRVDTSDRQAIFDWADQVAREHGRVNLIFNNAGVALSATLEKISQKDFDWIMGINFWGVTWGSQAFLPYLKASGDGHIINTSSLFGLMSMPLSGAYNASKFAVRGYTECLRMELEMAGYPVSATCVHPGGVRTNISRDARNDMSSQEFSGLSEDEAKKRFDKALDTTSAEKAALQILKAVEKNDRRVLVGIDAKIMDKVIRLMGASYQRIVIYVSRKGMEP